MEKKNDYYDEKYFLWQKKMGVFGGKANASKFDTYIGDNDTVLDFGCGGGYLLSNLKCKTKIGVEINEVARKQATENDILVYKSSVEVQDNSCDVIISNHALEHTLNPYEELKTLYSKLKVNGKIVFVVPNEKKKKYNPTDINKHLYTWCEINIGNLFDAVGYNVISVKELHHRWPPKYILINKIFGFKIFNLSCYIYGFLMRNLSQIRIVATKK